MSKIKLGLDIGTNSIGWAILEKEDGQYKFVEKFDKSGDLIPSRGSYIFPKGTEGNEKSKAAIRRGFRGARRRIDRIRLRKVATLKVLAQYDLCPPFDEAELSQWKNKKIYPCENETFIEWQRTGKKGGDAKTEKVKQPYYLRHIAATQPDLMSSKYGRYQLGRAFYHLAQRRGYLSNSEDEQTDDSLELFKTAVLALSEEQSTCLSFKESFLVIADQYKGDKKVKALTTKIKAQLRKNVDYSKLLIFINQEFNKEENLGKVASGILKLTKQIEESGKPTLGSYFYSIYNTDNGGLIRKIRGVYTHRIEHYLKEFNYICDKQNINGDLRGKLYNAIFYQRPLKSQKGLVAKCTLEPKRKRIAISHPLFEEFRMWESINRIKIKRESDLRLRPLDKTEKELILLKFNQKTDVEFGQIARILSKGKTYRYYKDKENTKAEIIFNFPMDKTFSACPTISQLRKVLGHDLYDSLDFLNTSSKKEKGKAQSSVEDVWHCLFTDSFGAKSKFDGRKAFAKKHLALDDEGAEKFARIQIKKGYGSLSKSAIKKIIPFLQEGELYSHAVFLANISEVIGRKPSEADIPRIKNAIKDAIEHHKDEKGVNAVVNNYIEKYKYNKDSLGDDPISIRSHKNSIYQEMEDWYSKEWLNGLTEEKNKLLLNTIWLKFKQQVYGKRSKDIEFVGSTTIPKFIEKELKRVFPKDEIFVGKLFHPSAIEAYPKAIDKLGNPVISSIKNPVFYKAMFQIRRLINKLIEEGMVDKDTEVVVEMAREINSASYRLALDTYNKEQQVLREWARNKIIDCYEKELRKKIKEPTNEDVTKYILYCEQRGKCIYTGEEITPRQIFTDQKFDIEHTIPRSKCNDNALSNKTLTDSQFNRDIKRDILPANISDDYNGRHIDGESIILNRDNWLRTCSVSVKNKNVEFNVSLSSLKEACKRYKNAAKATSDENAHNEIMVKFHLAKMKYDYLWDKYKRFEIEEVTSRFTNANLVDTRIITKYARAYLNSYFNKVYVVNGKITDTLRKIWGLQGEYEEKDRSNHIHHCIDAVTVACIERGTVNRISEAYHNYETEYFNGNESARIPMREPMENFVARMKELHKDVFIYHHKFDRIQPLLEDQKKDNPVKLNLRGALNRPNPYGQIVKNDEKVFVQRHSITNLREKDIHDIIDETIKERIIDLIQDKELKKYVVDGVLRLPEYTYTDATGKIRILKEMILKKIRLKAYSQNQYALKKYRQIDLSQKKYKQDYFVLKEKNSNYRTIIFGDLNPCIQNERIKFINRDSVLINTYNIVKGGFPVYPELPELFSIKEGDMFVVFNRHTEEVNWDDKQELQKRLFKSVKFNEKGVLVFERHNYALGDVDHAKAVSDENLLKPDGFVLRRSPTTLMAIPVTIDALGRIDVKSSKEFIEKYSD